MRLRVLLFPLILALAACEQPPSKELAAAEAALNQARTDEAEKYAAEQFKEAEKALEEARRKVQAREYRAALSSATEAAERARQASQTVGVAKKLAQSAIQVSQVEVEAALDEADTIREDALKARIPEKAFEEVLPRLAAAREELAGLAQQVGGADLLATQQAASDLRKKATALAEAFREARSAWEAAHPKGRKPRR